MLYMGLEMDKFYKTLHRIFGHNTLICMGAGHQGKKIYQKWRKQAAATALFRRDKEATWLFYSPCNKHYCNKPCS